MRLSGSVVLRVFCITFLLGVVAFSFFSDAASSIVFSGEPAHIEGTVFEAEQTQDGQKVTLSHVAIDGTQAGERILVFMPAFPPAEVNQLLRFTCTLERPEPFNGFRYDRYLASKHIYATCFLREAPLVVGRADPSVRSVLIRTRSGLIHRTDALFGEPHASLLNGLILGEQRFREDWQARFQATGTTHIVAASGYNVAMVTKLCFAFLVALGLARPRAFSFLLASIFVYVFLAGADPPVIRAGIMGCLILCSEQMGRKSTMTNVLLLTASVMLLANPRLLRDDVGFQLSMASTIALIYVAPALESRFRFVPETFAIRENLVATFSATLFALPILFLSFGQLSVVGPLVNILILPLVPYAMAFGALAVLLGYISFPLAAAATGPAWALLTIILWVIEAFASLPIAAVLIPEVLRWPLAGITGILILFLWQKRHKLSVLR